MVWITPKDIHINKGYIGFRIYKSVVFFLVHVTYLFLCQVKLMLSKLCCMYDPDAMRYRKSTTSLNKLASTGNTVVVSHTSTRWQTLIR